VAEAVQRLRAWNFTTPTGIPEGFDASDVDGQRFAPTPQEIGHSVAATLYSVWRGQCVRNTLDAPLVSYGLPTVDDLHALPALRNLLDQFPAQGGIGASGVNFFNVPGVASAADRRDIILLTSLAEALDRLAGAPFAPAFANSANLDDYRWGKLHRIVLNHTLGGPFNIPPAGGAFPPPLPWLEGIPMDGGLGSVDAAIHNLRANDANGFMFTHGAVFRMVTTGGPGLMRGVSSVPGGVSGVLGSPHYADLLPGWLTNEAFPLWTQPNEVRQHASSVAKYIPIN
jgi:penicillin amidase